MQLDLERSRYVLRTRAAGFLSAFAHDLELEGRFSGGEAKKDGEAWSGRAVVLTSQLRVVGALVRDKVDPRTLSASDIGDIERRLRNEVLLGAAEVEIVATATDRFEILLAGRRAPAKLRSRVTGHEVRVMGHVSMKALGLAEVKGPLGAFTVKDEVEVEAHVFLVD